MKAQSEAVGALVLAFMVVFMLVGVNIALRQQAQVTRYNVKLADLIARRQMENIVFDYRDGEIYAAPSTEMDVLAVVAYNDTSVVYVNTSRTHLSVNQWTPLITDPQLASDIYNLKYVLGVITSTGNLITWMPPVTRIEKVTSLLFEAEKPGLRAYIVGNNTSIHLSTSYLANFTIYYNPNNLYNYNIEGYSIILQRNAWTVWAPVIVFYTGNVNIKEAFDGRVCINISSGNSYIYAVVNIDGSTHSISFSNAPPSQSGYFYIILHKYLANGSVEITNVAASLSKYRVGDGEVAVVSVSAGLSITVRDVLANTAVFSNALGEPGRIDTGYVAGTQLTAFLNGLIGVYANISGLSTYNSMLANGGIVLSVADLDSPSPSKVSVQLSLSTISYDLYTTWTNMGTVLVSLYLRSSGYVSNPARFRPPLNVALQLRLTNGSYVTLQYSFNTTNYTISPLNVTTPFNAIAGRPDMKHYIFITYNITLPNNQTTPISSNLTFMVNSVANIYSSPPTSTTPPPSTTTPPPPPPPSPSPTSPAPGDPLATAKILILQDPLPLNDTPISTDVYVIVAVDSSAWMKVLNTMRVRYEIYDLSGNRLGSGILTFSIQNTIIGVYPVASFNIPGGVKAYALITVTREGSLVAYARVYNYHQPQ